MTIIRYIISKVCIDCKTLFKVSSFKNPLFMEKVTEYKKEGKFRSFPG